MTDPNYAFIGEHPKDNEDLPEQVAEHVYTGTEVKALDTGMTADDVRNQLVGPMDSMMRGIDVIGFINKFFWDLVDGLKKLAGIGVGVITEVVTSFIEATVEVAVSIVNILSGEDPISEQLVSVKQAWDPMATKIDKAISDAEEASGQARSAAESAEGAYEDAETALGRADAALQDAKDAQGKAETAVNNTVDPDTGDTAINVAKYARTRADDAYFEATDASGKIQGYVDEAKGHSETAAQHSNESLRHSEQASEHSQQASTHSEAAAAASESARQHSDAAYGHSETASQHSQQAAGHSDTSRTYSQQASSHSSDANTYSLAAKGSAEDSEAARKLAEEARRLAENARAAAEDQRSYAESARSAAESARDLAETARQAAEGERSDAEEARRLAEDERERAESARDAAEQKRSAAENARKEADQARQQAVAAAGEAAESALTAVRLANPQTSIVPADDTGRPYWSYGMGYNSQVVPDGYETVSGDFSTYSYWSSGGAEGHTGPEAYIDVTDQVALKVEYWALSLDSYRAPAHFTFKDEDGRVAMHSYRQWAPIRSDIWSQLARAYYQTTGKGEWTKREVVVRLKPGTRRVRPVITAGDTDKRVRIFDLHISVFNMPMERASDAYDEALSAVHTASAANTKAIDAQNDTLAALTEFARFQTDLNWIQREVDDNQNMSIRELQRIGTKFMFAERSDLPLTQDGFAKVEGDGADSVKVSIRGLWEGHILILHNNTGGRLDQYAYEVKGGRMLHSSGWAKSITFTQGQAGANSRSVALIGVVAPTRPLMVLDPDSGDTVQTQFRNMMKEEGYDYRTATHVPFDIDASRVTDLNGLFQDCRNLVRAPEIKWTARVSTAAQMFYGCERLAFVPEFDTSGIQNMTRMFYGCSNLTFVPPLRMFNATTTTYMFANCTALEEVQAMDTSAVKDMSYMFYNCASLRKAPQIHAFSATNLAGMFQACMSLEEVPDMYVNPGVTSMWAMFKDCTMLTDGKVRVFGKPDYTGPMTEGSGLTRNPLYEGNLPVLRLVEEPTGYAGQLQLRRALSAHGLSHGRVTSIPFDIDCSETESIAGLFMDCTSMRTAPNLTLRDEDGVTVADTSNVKNMSYLFANCTSLTSVPPINTNSVETMEAMFGSCRSLRELPDLLTHKTANTMFMFENASNLRDGSVRLIGRRPDLVSTGMIQGSGLTREPFYSPSGSAV